MKVALALGSGAARGYAHIGVIEELTARGHEIVGVAGSSMGAVVGGVLAAGKLDEFSEWAQALTQRAMLKLVDPTLHAAGVLRAEKILGAVGDILGPVAIEDFQIPFTAVATDLLDGRSVWLQRGPAAEAIRASIAIPGLIAPGRLDGRLLGDGGILDPVPMAPIAAARADLTIAASITGVDPNDTDADRLGSFDVMNRSIDIAQAALARHILAAYPPGLLIAVPRSISHSLDFHRATEIIAAGREVAAAALDEYESRAATAD